MLKVLMKKQFAEMNTWLTHDKKTGTRRDSGKITGMIILYIFIFLFVAFAFFGIGVLMAENLHAVGLDWLYYAMMAIMASALGIFGSVFNSYSKLYLAKDNELLLSMPIPPAYILISRVFGVFVWSALYEALVFVPGMIAHWVFVGTNVVNVISNIIMLILIAVFVMALSCILGWVIARVSVKLKKKSIVSVFIGLVFFAAYYYLNFKLNEIIRYIVEHAEEFSRNIQAKAYPVYAIGMGANGNLLLLAACAVCIIALFVIVYLVMTKTFIKLATTKVASGKKKAAKFDAKSRGMKGALFAKEMTHFLNSATYMLNCGLGIVFLIAGGVALIVVTATGFAGRLVAELGVNRNLVAIIISAVICLIASMNDIAAPSVSLEGKNLWILQTLPVPGWEALKAKIKLNVYLSGVPTLFCSVCAIVAVRPGLTECIMLVVMPLVFVIMHASFSLMVNVKRPNLVWTSEVTPIKQSLPIALALFGGWVLILILAAIYFLVGWLTGAGIYMFICAIIFAVISFFIMKWLQGKGAEEFEKL